MPYVKTTRPLGPLPKSAPVRHSKPTGPDNDAVLAVLKRAEGRCEVCGVLCAGVLCAGGRGWDWSVHHRRGRQGARTDNSVPNLVLVDSECHHRIHQHRTWAQGSGFGLPRNGLQIKPAQVPVLINGGERWVYFTPDGLYGDTPPDIEDQT